MSYITPAQIAALKVTDSNTAYAKDLNDTLDALKSSTDSIYVDTQSLLTVLSDCQTAQAAAEAAEDNALDSEVAAASSETNAAASEVKANEWAEEPEDSEVETGQYSALHWAAKAASSVSAEKILTAGTDIDIGIVGNTYTFNHDDTSSMSSIDNSATTVLQDATVDGRGHMTAMGSVQLTGYFNLASGTNTWSGTNTFTSYVYVPNPPITEDGTRVATTAFVKDAYPGHAVGYASWSPTLGGVYTNTVGRPVIVAGTLNTKYAMEVRVDGVVIMETDSNDETNYIPFLIVVPEGSTYGISGSASGLVSCFRML